jgi:hypothetical protein
MKGSNREIWRCFLQKVFKNRNLKNKIANRLNLARKTKKTSICLAILKKSANYLQRRKKALERSEGNYLGLIIIRT